MDLSNVAGELSIEIAAPTERVWDLVTDLSLAPSWNRETVETVWLDPERPPGRGSVFEGTNRLGDMVWTVPCHVIEWDPPRVFGWTVLEPEHPSSMWSYRLHPDADGRHTVLGHGFRHGPGPSGLRYRVEAEPDRASELIEQRTAMLLANMAYTLEQIKERAERTR
jgi:uncharacterized protein YndB with AHSA1/START domain